MKIGTIKKDAQQLVVDSFETKLIDIIREFNTKILYSAKIGFTHEEILLGHEYKLSKDEQEKIEYYYIVSEFRNVDLLAGRLRVEW